MGMQVHFNVADIPENQKVHKHSDLIDDSGDGSDTYTDSYIVVDPYGWFLNTDAKHEQAWFDCGSTDVSQMNKIIWLIQNRICFNVS